MWHASRGKAAKTESEEREAESEDSESRCRSPLPASRVLPEAERRQLTVLFCDVVGSTALSEQLDPEELREVVRAYHETCAAVIRRYAGHTAQHLGDGILVYFGYPAAHEDDAQRAVRTGLEIVAALQHPPLPARHEVPSPLAGEGQGEGVKMSAVYTPHPNSFDQAQDRLPPQGGKELRRLQVRIGIHTGLVVIGEIGSSEKREILALGETPNLAARLQALAEPDTVMISAATQRLVTGLFECEDLGPQTLKGISTPLSVYRVVGEGAAHSRFEVAIRSGLTPLVGRDLEIGLLRERWVQAKEGQGQVVLLSGEPGIGKSRLVEVLKDTVGHEGATCLELHCSPYHQNSALYPVIEHVQRLLHFQADETPENKLEKLQRTLSRYRFPQADTLPLLAALLSLPHPERCPPLNLSPSKQKQKTQEALVSWLVEEAEKTAVYCVWEDVHWADPSSLEFLGLSIDQAALARLLLVLTFRPEFALPWASRSHLTPLTLSRLPRTQAEEMVEKVTGGKVLPPDVCNQIVSKTDGVPLFVEELTKMVVEAMREQVTGDGLQRHGIVGARGQRKGQAEAAPVPLTIPTTLRDSLMARLDRLGSAKEIAQVGAVLGREFSYELLHAVSSVDEERLQRELKQLVAAELIYQRGLVPQAHYLFKHALIQDTAYQSLLKSTRQQYHRQIAQVLAERFIETVETQPELVAHHYTEAGLIEQAIPYWQRAGERANQRSAYVEAIAHLTNGLEVLKTLPDTPERVQHELALQLALSDALSAVKGFAAPEVGKAATRARELCQHLGETPQLSPILYRLSWFYMIRGEVQTAHELAKQMLRLAQNVHNPLFLMRAHLMLGTTLFFLGEFALAREHLEEGSALYDPQQHRSYGTLFDPKVSCLSYAALALWFLGYPDQAQQRSHEVLILAQELSHPFSLTYALDLAARLLSDRREGQAAQERAEAVIALSIEQGFQFYVAAGTIRRGWALAEQGQVEEGIAQMQQGLAAFRATRSEVRPYLLALLAEAYRQGGQAEEGLAVLAEALALMDKSGERNYEAEMYRLKGELTLQKLSVTSCQLLVTNPQHLTPSTQAEVEQEAEECFLKAIEIARRQQAKSLELRATTSLARLWQQQGKHHAARNTLFAVYNWFTEGFDTKDLQEAKKLLEELA